MALEDLQDQELRDGTTPQLPAMAAGDLEALRKSIEDSAAVSGGLWLSYLFVLFYLGIAAGGVTHADLLLQNSVKLPFLNVELPLLAFFFLAPLLFVITHAYMLVNLDLLADRVRQFHGALRDHTADPALAKRGPEIRRSLTRQLPSHVFVQFLGGPEEIRQGAFGGLLAAILWITLVLAPAALLLLLQIQFLPYHELWITWTSRIALIIDLGLLWWLWRNILGSSQLDGRKPPLWRPAAKTAVAILLSGLIILFACAVATIPSEWGETVPVEWQLDHPPPKSALKWLSNQLFYGKVNETTRRRTSLFSNTLVLPAFNIYEALKIDDPKKVEWRQYLIDLRGRDLKGAVLYRAILTQADFAGAKLQRANLGFAQLQRTSLVGARLAGAQLSYAHLQGADLGLAQLQGASLIGTRLDGAQLGRAGLQGASLSNAHLQGAFLGSAGLQGASLFYAQLQGASLSNAHLQGADLRLARLDGAVLETADLQGAQLDEADLQGAELRDALVWRMQQRSSKLANLYAPAGSPDWSPKGWTHATYTALREFIGQQVPEGERREEAVKSVAILDCAQNVWHGLPLAPCDPSADVPEAVKQWQKQIEDAKVGPDIYARVLAKILGDLVCSTEPDRIEVLRGLLRGHRFVNTRNEMPPLKKRITSAECPVSSALTDDDKRYLTTASDEAIFWAMPIDQRRRSGAFFGSEPMYNR